MRLSTFFTPLRHDPEQLLVSNSCHCLFLSEGLLSSLNVMSKDNQEMVESQAESRLPRMLPNAMFTAGSPMERPSPNRFFDLCSTVHFLVFFHDLFVVI
jgi:hypothetical protein